MWTRGWMRGVLMSVLLSASVCVAQDHDHHAHAAPKAVPGESMPFARLTDDGRLHLVFVADDGNAKRVVYRQMFGDAPVESAISAPEEKLSHWPESPPKVEVTRDGVIHVLYTVRASAQVGEGAPVELRYSFSTDGGNTWAAPAIVGDPQAALYRSCASMREDTHGALVLSWLEAVPERGTVGVRTAIRRGDSFDYTMYDDKACECCATELLRAQDGTMWLGYRDVDESNVRDMFLARMTPEADRFGPAARISRDRWVVPGCPDTGPRFTLTGSDAVWAAWYSGSPAGIYAARADTSTPKFAERELVQGVEDGVRGVAHPGIGTLPDGRVLVAYECTRDGEERIEGRVRGADGWGEPIRIGDAGEYPRICSGGEHVYLVYTAVEDGQKSIRVCDLAELAATKAL